MRARAQHWFEPLADHLGRAYLRYSFTYGTRQEVAFLVEQLGLEPPARILDVGCGPGRHARELASRGHTVVGVDISWRFLALAAAAGGASYVQGDAAALPVPNGRFDLVLSLCQGAFGLMAGPGASPEAGGASPSIPPGAAAPPGGAAALDPDGVVLTEMARAVRPGGWVVVSAFSAYHQVRYLGEGAFDADRGVHHERTEIRSETGDAAEADLWTSCFTPRELRLLAVSAGLDVHEVWSVTPGAYAATSPNLETPEFLLVARRPLARW